MSDHERGAYTPQPDAPLSFDVRVARERRPLPLALIASCVILSTLVVVAFMLYRSGVRSQNEPPRPVGEPIAAIKAAPPTSEAPPAAAPGAAPAAGQPAFAPAPEQPMARPAPGQQVAQAPAQLTVQQSPQQPMQITAPAQPAPQAAKPAPPPAAAPAPAPVVRQAAAPPAPAPKPVPAPVVAKAAPAPAKPVVAAAKPAPAAAAPAAGGDPALKAGSIVVQIGAFTSADLAKAGWQRVAGLVGGAINGKGRHIEPVDAGGTTRYRSQVTGFTTHADAASFCAALKAKGHDCIVKATN